MKNVRYKDKKKFEEDLRSRDGTAALRAADMR